jgi:hypothetical protein
MVEPVRFVTYNQGPVMKLKTNTITRILLLVMITGLPLSGLSQSSGNKPVVLIRELYRVHNKGYGPVFEGKSKSHLVKYFDKRLSDLIWKELTDTSGEVGNLDFDPLYNAQEIEIKNFQVANPIGDNNRTEIMVSFNNFDQQVKIKFLMRNTEAGWKIENLIYEDGSDLVKMLSAPR